MKKIMFTDSLERLVIEGKKDMTRRIIKEMADRNYKKPPLIRYICRDCSFLVFKDENDNTPIILYPKYKIGEVVVVAQRYSDFRWPAPQRSDFQEIRHSAGWKNKMYVKADLMPHNIRITDVRVERLQDISDEDCLREGVLKYDDTFDKKFPYSFDGCGYFSPKKKVFHRTYFESPKPAFAALIDKISGKGTWNDNPFVFVYEFKLVE